MEWTTTINPQDDTFHPRTADPYWNESHWVSFMCPERETIGIIYYYFRPNMKLCVGGPVIWDGNGDEIYDCLYYAWDQCMAMPEGAEMNDFTMPNGLSVSTVDLQREYRLRFDATDCQLDLTWSAVTEPHYMRTERKKINPGISDFAQEAQGVTLGHYEQAGMVSGTVIIRGDEYRISGGSLRDHTWAPREQITNNDRRMRGGYPFVCTGPDSSFHAYCMAERPLAEDPIFDTSERLTSGFYVRDGVKAGFVDGTRKVLERGSDGRPLRESLEGTDELGRTLHAECTYLNWLKWPCYSDLMPWYGLVRWEYDGRTEYGLNADYMYYKQNRKLFELLGGKNALDRP